MSHQLRRLAIILLTTALVSLLVLGASGVASGKKKHKRLRLTCDQTTDAISGTAQELRAKYNAMGFTIEDAPNGVLVGSGCKNVGKLTRQGSAYMADVHHTDDGSPPFPGETNPDVYAYHWQWNEIVTRTKKGRIRTTVTDFQCTREAFGPPPEYDVQVLPC
jgi:hypothetical protein